SDLTRAGRDISGVLTKPIPTPNSSNVLTRLASFHDLLHHLLVHLLFSRLMMSTFPIMKKRKGSPIENTQISDPSKKLKQGNLSGFFKSGSSSPAATKSTKASRWNKHEWVQGLTEDQKVLLKLEIDTLHESWLAELHGDLTKDYFLQLKRFLSSEKQSKNTVYPQDADIYSWSRHTPLQNVKVVILGQDPYHQPNQAHGLSFSVRPPTAIPPSLHNIYKCLVHDYPDFVSPKNGLLTSWARQGVLLLNSALTVRANQANSHQKKGWETFTAAVIKTVEKTRPGVVFLAWGKNAEGRVTTAQKHCILKGCHPSPLAQASAKIPFIQCGHFKKANEWLRGRYGKDGEVNWNSLVVREKVLDEIVVATATNNIYENKSSKETKVDATSIQARADQIILKEFPE
ncbi:Uracil-DNA glycosylase, partial [Neolecta irregularis DAH-3]